jgi:hypothetical protein
MAREIYRQITNPRAAPDNSDLRQMRTTLAITTAARELGQWPSKISLLERGLLRNDTLASDYRQWLTEQSAKLDHSVIVERAHAARSDLHNRGESHGHDLPLPAGREDAFARRCLDEVKCPDDRQLQVS